MEENQEPRSEEEVGTDTGKPVGTGRKVGVYAIIFIVVAILLFFVLLFVVGYLPPEYFQEEVGP